MATWRRIIEDALLEIGVLAQGESAEGGQLAHAARLLDDMLEQWAGMGLLVPGITRLVHTVTRQARFWTIGPATVSENDPPDILGGPFEQILSLSYRYQGETDERPMVEIDLLTWNRIQSITGFHPRRFWFDPTAHPYQALRFDRNTLAGDLVVIEGRTIFQAVPVDDLSLDAGFPRAYGRAIRQNLAVEIAPANGVDVTPNLRRNAVMSKRLLQKRNIGDPEAILDLGLRQRDGFDLRRRGRSYDSAW